MPIITEGNIAFNFPTGWLVEKYDDTDFYRSSIQKTGADLRAVDIIASPLTDPNYLLLIEVKDFRGHGVANRKRQASGELVEEVIRKALHTLSGLFAAKRVGDPILQQLGQVLIDLPGELELILFMEDDVIPPTKRLLLENQKKFRQDIELELRSKLKKPLKIQSRVLDISSIKPRDGWSAV